MTILKWSLPVLVRSDIESIVFSFPMGRFLMTREFVLILSQGHFGQVQGHLKEKCKILSGPYFSYGETFDSEVPTPHLGLLMTWGCVVMNPGSVVQVQGHLF